MKDELIISIDTARVICGLDYVCWCEGIGPNSDDLMKQIIKEYPELIEEFQYLEDYK